MLKMPVASPALYKPMTFFILFQIKSNTNWSKQPHTHMSTAQRFRKSKCVCVCVGIRMLLLKKFEFVSLSLAERDVCAQFHRRVHGWTHKASLLQHIKNVWPPCSAQVHSTFSSLRFSLWNSFLDELHDHIDGTQPPVTNDQHPLQSAAATRWQWSTVARLRRLHYVLCCCHCWFAAILSPLRSFFAIVAREDKACQCRPVSFRDLLLLTAHG